MASPSSPAAGWYSDPKDSDGERYWDGAKWTQQTRLKEDVETLPPPVFSEAPSTFDAGWYVDPRNSAQERYWTGKTWDNQVRKASSSAKAGPAPPFSPNTHSTGSSRSRAPISKAWIWVAVAVVGVFVIGSIVGGGNRKTSTSSTPTSPPAHKAPSIPKSVSDARSYIKSLSDYPSQVQTDVANTLVALGTAQSSSTESNLVQLATTAQEAHNDLDNLRMDISILGSSDNGTLGDAEYTLGDATNQLKNAMGAMVGVTDNATPGAIASFTTQYQSGVTEWNSSATTIWHLAHESNPPLILPLH